MIKTLVFLTIILLTTCIASAGNSTICSSGCDYTSLSAWESAKDGDLTGNGAEIAIITGEYEDTTPVTIDGWVTTAADYIMITSNGTARHNGTWNSSKFVSNTTNSGFGAIYIRENYVRVDGLQFNLTATSTTSRGVGVYTTQSGGSDIRITDCIFRLTEPSTTCGIGVGTAASANNNITVQNSIFMDFNTTNARGVYGGHSSTFRIYNCVMSNNVRGIEQASGTMNVSNTASFDNTDDFLGTMNITHCASDDGDGTSAQTPSDWTNEFIDYTSCDYRLKSGSILKDNGITITSFSDDIIGTTRPQNAVWDIGVFEYGSAGTSYYMANTSCDDSWQGNITHPVCNLTAAFALMSTGDTLVVKNGTYTGSSNAITHAAGYLPPNGTVGAYTTIMAEHDGEVVFDGENIRSMVYIDTSQRPVLKYVQFVGIVWLHDYGDRSHLFSGMDHVKILRCGFGRTNGTGGASIFSLRSSNYTLVEECYSWGDGRYAFMTQTSDYIVFRRNVGRLDGATGGGLPISVFQNYCSRYVEYQNNIAIDVDDSYFLDWSYSGGGFVLRKGPYDGHYSENINVTGNIALNLNWWKGGSATSIQGVGFRPTRDNRIGHVNHYRDNVAWDVPSGGTFTGNIGGSTILKNFNIFVIHGADDVNNYGYGFRGYEEWNIKDSIIIHGDRAGLRSGIISDYNAIYDTADDYADGTVAGANDYSGDLGNAINPIYHKDSNPNGTIMYILRSEVGGNLYTNGSDGGPIGATIINKTGTSGTLWGESEWNTETTDCLWPFSNETVISDRFRTYNIGQENQSKPDGIRGFTADNQTLTKYIWEYIGHPNPYKQVGEDSFILSKLNISTGTTSANITFKTNILTNSTVEINDNIFNDTEYLQTNSINVTGLTPGTKYTYGITYSYNTTLNGTITGLQLTTSTVPNRLMTYYNTSSPIQNIVNSTGYNLWNRTITGNDNECDFNLEVTI